MTKPALNDYPFIFGDLVRIRTNCRYGGGPGALAVVIGIEHKKWDKGTQPFQVIIEGCPRRIFKFTEHEIELVVNRGLPGGR